MLCARNVTQYTISRIALNVYSSLGAEAKVCSHVPYRNHPRVSQRTSCGHELLKGDYSECKKNYPYKTYCYFSLYKSLSHLLQRKGYIDLCESCRNR